MQLQAVSSIQIQKIRESVAKKYALTIPTYTVKLPNGEAETHQHTAESINDVNTPQVEKDAWDTYQTQLELCNAETQEKVLSYVFYKGIVCDVSDEWLSEQEWLGIELPNNPGDLKVLYIETELLKTPAEIQQAFLDILKLSAKGVDNSAIQAAEATFSSSLQEK